MSGSADGGTGLVSAGNQNGDAGARNDGECIAAKDCTPPDPLLCSRACQDHQCTFAPTGSAFTTGPLTEDHRTGGFDSAGVPYVFWGDSRGTPSAIVIQRIDDDGAPAGVAAYYLLPAATENLEMFDATFSGGSLGLIYNAQLPATDEIVTAFDVTHVDGIPGTPITLSQTSLHDKYVKHAYTQLASPIGSRWLLAEFSGVYPASWRALTVDPASPPVSPPFNTEPSPLTNPPVCSDSGRVAQSAAVVGSVLYLSGYTCDWYQLEDCLVKAVLARYDSKTLEALDPPMLDLTVNPVAYEPGLARVPVFGGLSQKLAVFWSEFSTPTEFTLGSALFNADGSVAKSRVVAQSSLVPKAFVEVGQGGGLLLVSRRDASTDPPRYRLEAQLLDEQLEWVGEPVAVDGPGAQEPSDVRALVSPDKTRVLVTFRQGQARHRLLQATLCR